MCCGEMLRASCRNSSAAAGSLRQDYRLYFGPTNVAIWEVSLAVELCDDRAAISKSKTVRLPKEAPTERRSHRWIDLARAHVLAKRPHDLRHGCASLLLNSGVPATEVARRLGHSLTVLMSTYAHWFTGMEQEANRLIDAALSGVSPPATVPALTGSPRAKPPET